MLIGAQMFTVRESTANLTDFAETLKRIADIGYTTVQVSGTCPYDPAWLDAELKKNGLKCVITHTPPDKMVEDPMQVVKNHNVFDCKYIGIGGYSFEGSSVAEFKEKFTPVVKTYCENGKYLMYHNHNGEFKKENGIVLMDQIATAFTPEEMGFTLDTYWVQAGGGNPAEWIEKLSGRVPCIHLKDYLFDAKMAPIGVGNINFDRVFAAAAAAGTEYMLVEQDDCYDVDPFECLKISYDYLKAQGFN